MCEKRMEVDKTGLLFDMKWGLDCAGVSKVQHWIDKLLDKTDTKKKETNKDEIFSFTLNMAKISNISHTNANKCTGITVTYFLLVPAEILTYRK